MKDNLDWTWNLPLVQTLHQFLPPAEVFRELWCSKFKLALYSTSNSTHSSLSTYKFRPSWKLHITHWQFFFFLTMSKTPRAVPVKRSNGITFSMVNYFTSTQSTYSALKVNFVARHRFAQYLEQMWMDFSSLYIILELSISDLFKKYKKYISIWDEAFGQGSLTKLNPKNQKNGIWDALGRILSKQIDVFVCLWLCQISLHLSSFERPWWECKIKPWWAYIHQHWDELWGKIFRNTLRSNFMELVGEFEFLN